MNEDDVKIEELRLLFDRENSRKQGLESKASYFLGCISIIITIICTFSHSISINNLFYMYIGWGLIISFILSVGFCISIFLPKKYYHPFRLNDFNELESSFNENKLNFKKNLYNQYLTAVFMNHNLNDNIVKKLRYSVFYFVWFLMIFIVMEAIL